MVNSENHFRLIHLLLERIPVRIFQNDSLAAVGFVNLLHDPSVGTKRKVTVIRESIPGTFSILVLNYGQIPVIPVFNLGSVIDKFQFKQFSHWNNKFLRESRKERSSGDFGYGNNHLATFFLRLFLRLILSNFLGQISGGFNLVRLQACTSNHPEESRAHCTKQ